MKTKLSDGIHNPKPPELKRPKPTKKVYRTDTVQVIFTKNSINYPNA